MSENPGPGSIRSDAEPAADRERAASGVAVVGIGASAGGLDAFRQLLSDLPADTGMAFVLIQHLDPTHQSGLRDILSRATTMPVSDAGNDVRVEPNHVYVIPPNTELTIVHGVLQLSPRGQTPGPHMPIDHFLRSLARDCRRRAIGVILSGAGSDGALGLQAVKEAGGVTFAQEPSTAEFASMPQMAEAATCVDFVLPPERIAAELARIADHPHFAVAHPGEPEDSPPGGNAELNGILTVMHEATGIDFSRYREATVKRRIMRRLALRNIPSIEGYAALLKQDPGERGLLQRDLLISVTSFFRDPGSFDGLTRLVFPALVRNRPAGAPIRIWVPGCATGEEAYSMVISLQEYLRETGATFPIQVFATDISDAAVEKARIGKYLENIVADVSPERLTRNFTRVEGGYQVSRALRELCVFSRHDLIDDPPFARLDLISCRNVLIYLGTVQKEIIPLFHYALREGGFLMLGRSETANLDDMFSLIDRDHRIYAKKETSGKIHRFPVRGAPLHRGVRAGRTAARAPSADLWDGVDLGKAVDRILLSKYSPAAVLVDEGLEVLEIRGDATPFFRLPAGKLTFHLLKLIPDTGLFLEIEKLAHEVVKSGETARRARVPYESGDGIHEVNIEVAPLTSHQKRAFLVLLEPAQKVEKHLGEPPKARAPDEAIASRDRHIAKLQQEVAEARRRLLSVVEEHQITDEESQSAAEEAMSANEELQSLNEELETAKEELQSTNEELNTINQEVEAKNRALTESRNFADSIVETVGVPLLVLDNHLQVKSVNHAFSRTFLISPRDAEGQPFGSLGRGSWDIPGLRDRLNRVLATAESFDNFEVEREFPSIGTRHLIAAGRRLEHLDLILVAIEDITVRKEAEKALQQSQEALRQSQKMEAIGRLAGGIAHDFNNLLTAILGYSRLVIDNLGEDHQVTVFAHEIEKAGQRAAVLTDQLLAFSRRKLLQIKVVDLNAVVADFERMLRRVVGEQIRVIVRPDSQLWRVKADPGEIGRALMNLCLNARDAMPAGGTLTIQTANVAIDEAEAKLHGLAAGRYIELVVRDTGTGMDFETQTHLFEPFFTTKETGKGTGLGLASVLGIVQQSGGTIWCQSELGQGTRFKILLPALEAVSDLSEQPAGGPVEVAAGSEVILLVEDGDQVRRLASTILQGRGYVVLEARDGRDGLSVCEAHQGKIDLLLTDVVMPELGGRELAERILKMRPDIKVLFMSGHTLDVILKEGIQAGTPFLQKPFGPNDLARKVREVLDSEGQSQSAGQA